MRLSSGRGTTLVPTTITGLTAHDVRFPTSRALDGSDAMNPDPDYSAAYVILGTDGTTVVHTSALLNPGNALGSPADLVYDVAAANGGNPVLGQFVKIKRFPDATGGSGLDDARVLSLGEVQVRHVVGLLLDPKSPVNQ